MPERKLFLTSAGTDIREEILKILPKPASEMKLAHIITASKVEEDLSYLKKEEADLRGMGFQVENVDLEGVNEKELREILKDKNVIYVQGGNTFYLLKYVRESGFDKIIKELIEKGVIYIGVSAGSYIAGPTIDTATWKNQDINTVGLEDLTALNLVPFLILAHYEEKLRDLIEEEIPKAKYPVKVLTDKQAISVQGDKIELVGEGEEIMISD
ncbi:MAG: Type 1 glutamine amidotransferase-like domain-containing protein [Patescibacteria group bacterium]|jgi:dipeptidase E|nr:Type 1 glutamine amidotransferase-like domain-containing protein [Patescibacteria group bacterium]